MIITSIQFTFSPQDTEKAKTLLREIRDASVKEPGVILFEVGQSSEEPNVFALWEVYRDKDAFEAHRKTEHFERLVLNGIRPLAQERISKSLVPI
jgi:quinol monooxygenase YgiN